MQAIKKARTLRVSEKSTKKELSQSLGLFTVMEDKTDRLKHSLKKEKRY